MRVEDRRKPEHPGRVTEDEAGGPVRVTVSVFSLTGLHVFPTFVVYELTVLMVLTLSVVIMKVEIPLVSASHLVHCPSFLTPGAESLPPCAQGRTESAQLQQAAHPDPLASRQPGYRAGKDRGLRVCFPSFAPELGMFEMGSYEGGAGRSDFWTSREAPALGRSCQVSGATHPRVMCTRVCLVGAVF